jgi:hypothetical protein
MATRTDRAAALEFLRWWFGQDPAPHFIGISYQRDLDDSSLEDAPQVEDPDDELDEVVEARGRKGKRDVDQCVYTSPEKALMSQWEEEAERSHIYFCTTPLLKQKRKLAAANAAGVPGLWVDIDAMRELDIDGEEFYTELRDQEEASCWTRSSAQGIQGFFRLKKFFSLEDRQVTEDEEDEDSKPRGKNRVFKSELKPLLLNLAYYFGGDIKVVSPARLMRLPGSKNPKRDDYVCKAQYFDHAFAMAELRKRFKQDEHLVPKVVLYAIAKAMEKVYGPGSHHEPSVHLFGTCRMAGLDEESCRRLAEDLYKFFKDMKDDPSPSVETTYSRDPEDGLVTLRNDYEQISDEVEKAVKFWINLKVKYCKAIGVRWKPEMEGNPLSATNEQSGDFVVKSDGTYYTKKETDEYFANFSIRLLHKILKIDGSEVTVAELTFKDRRYQFEWPSEKDSSFAQFKKIKQLPPGATVLVEVLWKAFIAWLYEQPVEKYLKEMPYYGLINVKEKKPTLLLPGRPHSELYCAEPEHDTANHQKAFRDITKREAVDYLTNLARYYPRYHEKKFIWCALGWFAATPFSAFAYAKDVDKGFPVLLISGLKESGKSSLITNVLSTHMGCVASQTYLGTTAASRRTQLASNNLIPLVVDEFRDVDETRTDQFTDLIRNLWDQSARRAKNKDGGAAIDWLIGTMCVVGEHSYEDSAALDRTVSIHISRDFIESTFDMTEKKKARLTEARRWLESTDRSGMLGSILIQWMQEHLDRIPTILDRANAIIAKNMTGRQLRNRTGFSIVVFGLLVMNEVFKHYDVDFPLDKDTMIEAIHAADEAANTNTIYGAANLKTLFALTDTLLIEEIRKGTSLQRSLYEFDIEDDNIVYFDMGRWHQYVYRHMRGSKAAALVNKTAFFDLLHVSANNEDSPVIGFPTDHVVFPMNCVKINLTKVREQFGINVKQWNTEVEDCER